MLNSVNLVCPLCQQPLTTSSKQLSCANGHSFDIAKQGYVNLLPVQKKHSKDPGDNKVMVNARRDFLAEGHFNSFSQRMTEVVKPLLQQGKNSTYSALEAGCGEGFYIDSLARDVEMDFAPLDAYGLDISKWAVQAATKRNNRVTWLVGSNAALPFAPGSLDLIICAFGFYQFEWFAPYLKPGGRILLLEAGDEHLLELREALYDEVRRGGPPANLEHAGFTLESQECVTDKITLEQVAIQNLLCMTPHGYKAPVAGKEAVLKLNSLNVTIQAVIRLYQKA
ncbi:putative RNA methyltransferase [Pokkaliibacter sp. CJK22405]|uniref:putative RNA methyltransferase n=1 Tax=Pokkaliibacter sp. CJK22405 TaxID=3384615 RepID=UPI003984F34B